MSVTHYQTAQVNPSQACCRVTKALSGQAIPGWHQDGAVSITEEPEIII
jgi:hypothetical protein